ncbi:MAG: hypothetical protein ACE5JX_08135 [Acidobacteriota bacterium]
MQSRLRLTFTAGCLAFLFMNAVWVQADDWRLLGERVVRWGGDHDVLMVTGSRGAFKKIKLRVKSNGIELRDLKVYFRNGKVQDVKVRKFIRAGGETRSIDLNGGARVIRKVELSYKTEGKGRQRRAVVRLWGRH